MLAFNIRLQQIPVNYHKLKEQLVQLHKLYFIARDTYATAFPEFNRKTDVRITVFAKCINIINSTTFGAQFMIDNILDDNWWNRTNPWAEWTHNDPAYDKVIPIREYDYFLKLGFVVGIFASIESSFRDYLRALIPSHGSGEFRCIYKKLFELLQIDQEYDKLLGLYSLTRNSLHNNGVHYNNWKPDEDIIATYKGETYVFSPKKPVRVKWEDALMLARDSKDMLIDIVNRRDMISIPEIRESAAVLPTNL